MNIKSVLQRLSGKFILYKVIRVDFLYLSSSSSVIFPDDIEFRKVKACTTGRVFILKFKSSSRKMFFWMQEPKADKDEDNCKKVNDYLNNPPAARAGGGGSGSGSGRGGSGGGGSGMLEDSIVFLTISFTSDTLIFSSLAYLIQ